MNNVNNQITELHEDDVFLTENQLADRWQVSTKKLQADRWKGVGVPYVKISRSVRYRLRDVRAYEAQQLQVVRHG